MDDFSSTAVIGSCNFDVVLRTEKLPGASETQIGGAYRVHPGGKGLLQAVGLTRLGTKTAFCSAVGDDHFGNEILSHLAAEKVDTEHVSVCSGEPTGTALITLAKDGRTIAICNVIGSMLTREADGQWTDRSLPDSCFLLRPDGTTGPLELP